MTPRSPLTPVFESRADWNAGQNRCSIDGSQIDEVPLPATFVIPQESGTPNRSAAVLRTDGRSFHQSQPFQRCVAGSYSTSHYRYADGDLLGDEITGARGGSGLSSLGGTIRLGELVPGGVIRHAIKLNLDSCQYVALRADGSPGYRWPASQADSNAASQYGGAVPDLEMGALLALPPAFPVSSLVTEPGRILAQALIDYGGYVADSTGWDVTAVAVERGPNGRVLDEFEQSWGYRFEVACTSAAADGQCWKPDEECEPHDWSRDFARIVQGLQVVRNNGPTSIGGGGGPRVPLAPPFQSGGCWAEPS